MKDLYIKILSIWFGILILAILNGAFRETVLIPELGSTYGFVLSAVILSLLILTVTYFSIPLFGKLQVKIYIIIGICWLCLTVVFEFTFGHFVLDKPWIELLEAYTFNGGNLWLIVLIVVGIAPLLMAKARGYCE